MVSISVIIPVYNSEEYVARAIESVVYQTITHIEIICVDDGSDDRSAEIIKRYQETDSRIIYIYQENNGPGTARNTGLAHASGEYIAFLDSDDEYPDTGVLELLYTRAKSQNVSVCGGSVCGDWNQSETDLLLFEEGFYNFFDYQNDFMFWRYIYQNAFLIENGIRFPEYREYEDPVFLLEVMDKAQFFYAVSEYVYKKNVGHLTKRKKSMAQVKHRLLGCETNIKLSLIKKYDIIYYRNVIAMSNLSYRIIEMMYDDEADNELFLQLFRIALLIKVKKIPRQYKRNVLGNLRKLLFHLVKKDHNHFLFWFITFLKTEMAYDWARISDVVTK